ncbi:uncharacterized protein LOC119571794 [Penaeus monodon]|uniref:uncharacterized protein LOC119571794 n=1 Tax=Penaeus monodon TaxID=6687 RepID=UPI0018A7606D|nr:uncharacterized protein LOC119571794 [Penaeus monodon]
MARASPVGDARGHRRTLYDSEEPRTGGPDGEEKGKNHVLAGDKVEGSKAKELGNGFKLFYIGDDGRKNGVGIVLDEELKKGVLEVTRSSDRIIWLKMEKWKHSVTIDYILCRSYDKNTKDCKVILGETITNQHRPVICTLKVVKSKPQTKSRTQKIKWWKLKEAQSRDDFTDKVRETLERRRQEERCDWETIAEDMRDLERKSVAKPPEWQRLERRRGGGVMKSREELVRRRKQRRNSLKIHLKRTNLTNKTTKKEAKRAVATVKARAYNQLYEDLDTTEGTKKLMNEENPREAREEEQLGNPGEVEAITDDEVKER